MMERKHIQYASELWEAERIEKAKELNEAGKPETISVKVNTAKGIALKELVIDGKTVWTVTAGKGKDSWTMEFKAQSPAAKLFALLSTIDIVVVPKGKMRVA